MSVTTHLGCHDCKISLWIGQGEIIYTGEPETMRALSHFLHAHKNHKLEFYNENDFNDFNEHWEKDGYKNLTGEEYEKQIIKGFTPHQII